MVILGPGGRPMAGTERKMERTEGKGRVNGRETQYIGP